MSFAADVKKELTMIVADSCCQLAELSALLRSNGEIFISSNKLKIDYHTQNPTIAKRVVKLLKSIYNSDLELITKKNNRLKMRNEYIIRILSHVDFIINELELMEGLTRINSIPKSLVNNECCKRAYIRGVFISSGSVNNPRKSNYHLEMLIKSEEHAKEVVEMLNSFHFSAKITMRNKGSMVYLKAANQISDFLKLVGAQGSVMFFEDIRIYRDINNSINRMNNCDIANQRKIIQTANNQIANIDLIEKSVGLETLSEKLREAAILRKFNPEMSLNELIDISEEIMDKPLTKSGLNHRFRKLNDIAEEIRKGK